MKKSPFENLVTLADLNDRANGVSTIPSIQLPKSRFSRLLENTEEPLSEEQINALQAPPSIIPQDLAPEAEQYTRFDTSAIGQPKQAQPKVLDFSPGSTIQEMPDMALDSDVQDMVANIEKSQEQAQMPASEPKVPAKELAAERPEIAAGDMYDILKIGKSIGSGLSSMAQGQTLKPDFTLLDSLKKGLSDKEKAAMDKLDQESRLKISALSAQAKEAEIADEAAKKDPNSERSKAARDAVLSLFPQYKDMPGFSQASEEQLSKLFNFLNLKEQTDTRKQNAALFAQQREAEKLERSQQKDIERQLKLDAKEQERVAKEAGKVAQQFEKTGLGELDLQVNRIESLMDAAGEDLPGFGRVPSLLPNVAISEKGEELRQEVAGLRNAILKARSGAAITPQEATRLLEEIGSSAFASEQRLRQGVANARSLLNSKIQNIKGSVSPEALQVYSERSGIKLEPKQQEEKKPEDTQTSKKPGWAN